VEKTLSIRPIEVGLEGKKRKKKMEKRLIKEWDMVVRFLIL